MRCLEFRRHCLADPNSQEQDFTRHLRDCDECARHHKGLLGFEGLLGHAARVAPPEGMEARITLSGHLRRPRRWPLALAAALLLAIGGWWLSRPTLEAELAAHVHSEPDALAHVELLPDAEVAAVLTSVGVSGELEGVSYAGLCPLRGRSAGHLVLEHELGPVTLLLLPGEEATGGFEEAGLHGEFLPASWGTAALLGPETAVRELATQLELES